MGFANNQWFSHDLIRKYTIYFGSLFNDMTIQRFDKDENRIQTLPVPISYAPKNKLLVRTKTDPELDREVALQLPRMGFEITSYAYAGERKLNAHNKYCTGRDANGKVKTQFQSIPYDLTFSLYIMVKNTDDGLQLIEQILPFFTPDWTQTINTIPEMNISADVPLIFQSVVPEDVYEGDFESRRALIYTLDFVMKVHLYGPVKTSGIISKVVADIFSPTAGANTFVSDSDIGTTLVSHRITTTPGLTADGEPTSNGANSIDHTLISPDDDFGIVQQFEFFKEGKE